MENLSYIIPYFPPVRQGRNGMLCMGNFSTKSWELFTNRSQERHDFFVILGYYKTVPSRYNTQKHLPFLPLLYNTHRHKPPAVSRGFVSFILRYCEIWGTVLKYL